MPDAPYSAPLGRVAPALTFLLCLLLCAELVALRVGHPAGFDGDESDHALWGAVVYTDLAHADLPAFFRHLYAQTRFPPLYSVLQLPFLAGLGLTPLAHRLTATLWLFLLLVSVYLCVVLGAGRAAWPGACLAVLLAAACPKLLAVATTVYFDPACLALMMLTFALYLWARRGLTPYPLSGPRSVGLRERGAEGHGTLSVPPPLLGERAVGDAPLSEPPPLPGEGAGGGESSPLWPAAVCYALLWFLKWQHGLLVGIILVAHVLIVNGFRWSRLRHDRVAGWTLLPAWGAMVAWLANPYQAREFLMYLTGVPKPSGLYARMLEGYAMQGRFLVTVWSAGLPAALLTAAGLAYGLSRLRRPGALLYILAALAALVTSANIRGGAESRIMLWVLPPLWVLAGMGVNEGLAWLARHGLSRPAHAVSLPPLPQAHGTWAGEGAGGEAPLRPPLPPREGDRGVGVSALALGLLLLAAGNVAPALRQARTEISRPYMPEMWAALDWVTRSVDPHRRLVLVDCWGQGFPPAAVRWAYVRRYGPQGLSYDDLHVWDWPGLPQAPHPLRWRWPWQVRRPAGPPLPPATEALRLEAAGVDALLVCTRPGQSLDFAGELLPVAASLGFHPVADGPGPEPGLRLTAYLRPPAGGGGDSTRRGGE